MKKIIGKLAVCFVVLLTAAGLPGETLVCYGKETEEQSELIAGEEERAPSSPVGEEGMIPVYGTDVRDGVYQVEVESSSSMFRIVDAELTVSDGIMTAVITLGGTGYTKLFMGTGVQAVEAGEADYAVYTENADGAYTYTIQVEALNQELECTGFSKRKEKWYDHQILFRADTLPGDALLKQIAPVEIDVADGSYTIETALSGGTGKASVTSPARVVVTDKTGTVFIEWSSPNYDYMIVNGVEYFPANTEGNSVFEIPLWVLDEEMEVIADTTAMSVPHEISYTLIFYSDTLKADKGQGTVWAVVFLLAVILCGAGGAVFLRSRKRRNAGVQVSDRSKKE